MNYNNKAFVSPCAIYSSTDRSKTDSTCPKQKMYRDGAYDACPKCTLKEKLLWGWKGRPPHHIALDWAIGVTEPMENPILKLNQMPDPQNYYTPQPDIYYWIVPFDENFSVQDLVNLNGQMPDVEKLKCIGPFRYGGTQAQKDGENYPQPMDVVTYELEDNDTGNTTGTEKEALQQVKGTIYKSSPEEAAKDHRATYYTHKSDYKDQGVRKMCDVTTRGDRIDGFLRQFAGSVGLFSKFFSTPESIRAIMPSSTYSNSSSEMANGAIDSFTA